MKPRIPLSSVITVVCAVGMSVAAVWFMRPPGALSGLMPASTAAGAAANKPAPDKKQYKYISLEKVIVMLRGRPGETPSHYLGVDIVFKTTLDKEKDVKEQLPLLRSIAVKTLSNYGVEKAAGATVEQLTSDLVIAYDETYVATNREKPFSDVMIAKFIVE